MDNVNIFAFSDPKTNINSYLECTSEKVKKLNYSYRIKKYALELPETEKIKSVYVSIQDEKKEILDLLHDINTQKDSIAKDKNIPAKQKKDAIQKLGKNFRELCKLSNKLDKIEGNTTIKLNTILNKEKLEMEGLVSSKAYSSPNSIYTSLSAKLEEAIEIYKHKIKELMVIDSNDKHQLLANYFLIMSDNPLLKMDSQINNLFDSLLLMQYIDTEKLKDYFETHHSPSPIVFIEYLLTKTLSPSEIKNIKLEALENVLADPICIKGKASMSLLKAAEILQQATFNQLQSKWENTFPAFKAAMNFFQKTPDKNLLKEDEKELALQSLCKDPEINAIYAFLSNYYAQLNAAIEQKTDLLIHFLNENKAINFAGGIDDTFIKQIADKTKPPTEAELIFLIFIEQLLCNPLEPQIPTKDLMQEILIRAPAREENAEISLANFASFVFELNNAFEKLSQNETDVIGAGAKLEKGMLNFIEAKILQYPDQMKVYEIKYSGLQKIRQPLDNSIKPILISGGGPTGLMRGLVLALQEKPFLLLEQREPPNVREQKGKIRPNIILFGTDEALEMSLLNFFRVTNLLAANQGASFDHLNPGYMETKIWALECAMNDLLNQLRPDCIHYLSSIESLEKNENERMQVNVKMTDMNSEPFIKTIEPSMLIVAEGAHSSTSELLGIEKIPLSKTTKIILGIFKEPETPKSALHQIGFKITKGIRGAASVGALKVHSLISENDTGGAFFHFRVAHQDYVVSGQKEQEHAEIRNLEITIAQLKKEYDLTPTAEAKQRLEIAEKSLETYFRAKAESTHLITNFSLSTIKPATHRLKEMEYEKSLQVPVSLSKAKTPLVIVGKTPCIIRGDTLSTTDPVAGYGAKTGIASVMADLWLFAPTQKNAMEAPLLAFSYFVEKSNQFQDRAIRTGFSWRADYRGGTEYLSYYLDYAIQDHALTEEQSLSLERTYQKARLISKNVPAAQVEPLSEEEHENLVQLRKSLPLNILESLVKGNFMNATIATRIGNQLNAHSHGALTPAELSRNLTVIMNGELSDNEIKNLIKETIPAYSNYFYNNYGIVLNEKQLDEIQSVLRGKKTLENKKKQLKSVFSKFSETTSPVRAFRNKVYLNQTEINLVKQGIVEVLNPKGHIPLQQTKAIQSLASKFTSMQHPAGWALEVCRAIDFIQENMQPKK